MSVSVMTATTTPIRLWPASVDTSTPEPAPRRLRDDPPDAAVRLAALRALIDDHLDAVAAAADTVVASGLAGGESNSPAQPRAEPVGKPDAPLGHERTRRHSSHGHGHDHPHPHPHHHHSHHPLQTQLSAADTADARRFCDDACLRRYLRATTWDTDRAAAKLKDTLAWRYEYRPHEITPEEVRTEAVGGNNFVNGFDRYGRPVIYLIKRDKSENPELNRTTLEL
ncbi:hypothetical protein HK405_010927 [Cladochytrium tenue]|nr:hypothetical protein HK405_010927 [Cladochytrium tenue]